MKGKTLKNLTCDCTDRCSDCAHRDICCYCYTAHVTRKWAIIDTLDDVDVDSTDTLPYLG